MLTVRCGALFKDVRGDCAACDHADGDDAHRDFRADPAACQQRDGAFAHAALPDRGAVDPEPVRQEPGSHTEPREPVEIPDEQRREQRCGLVAEAAPQPLGVRLVLQSAVCAALKVRERALGQLLARALPVLQRVDRLRAIPAQPARVVEELETLALAVARPSDFASLVLRDAQRGPDSPVRHPLHEPAEDAPLLLRQLRRELARDQAILTGKGGQLRGAFAFPGLGHDTKARCPPRDYSPVTPFIAVQPQSALLDPVPQSVAEMFLAVIRPSVESERRLLVEVLELLGGEPSTLREAASDPQLSLLPFAENLTGPLRAKRPLPTLAGARVTLAP